MLPVILLLPALFVSLASGTAISPLPLNSLHRLLTRQSSSLDPNTIPAQCESRCNIVTTTVASCQNSANPACGCTVAVEAGFVDCLNCLIALAPSQTLLNSEQQYVNELVQLCNYYGASLPSTTLSGAVSPSAVASTTITGPTSPTTTRFVHTVTALSSLGASATSIGSPPATTARNVAVRDSEYAKKGVVVTLLATVAFAMLL